MCGDHGSYLVALFLLWTSALLHATACLEESLTET